MVINSNMAGAGGTPLAKSAGRPGSKTISPSDNPAGASSVSTLNSQADRLLASAPSSIEDADAARESLQFARTNILRQPAMAMLAQANLSPETALKLLQE